MQNSMKPYYKNQLAFLHHLYVYEQIAVAFMREFVMLQIPEAPGLYEKDLW